MTSRQELLARLVDEEQSLPCPERDWSRIEAAIVARIRRSGAPERKRPTRLGYVLALSAAAAVGLYAASQYHIEPERAVSPPLHPPAATSAPVAGAEVAAPNAAQGGTVESDHAEHAGRAHWTIEPGSSARVRRDGTVVVVELESGGIDAEVRPGRDPEAFVVEAGDVRVTVRGTQFRVERRGRQVDVSVWEGAVAVSARGEPDAIRVAAAGSKRFIDGKLSARPLPEPLRPRWQLRDEPTIGEVEAAMSRIQAAAQECFARYTSAKDGVEVSVRSNVQLSVRPDGSVAVRGFDPPLHPSVDSCTRAAIGAVRFPPSQRGIELMRALDLERSTSERDPRTRSQPHPSP